MYFDIRKAISPRDVLTIIVGNRGGGKTYSSLQFCLEEAVKKGKEFFYLRRYTEDCKDAKAKLFDAHTGRDFAGHILIRTKMRGHAIYGVFSSMQNEEGMPIEEERRIGYIYSLTEAERIKSIPFPDVTTLIYEEFISEKNKYLENEIVLFFSIYETIDRQRNELRVFMLGNNASSYNPYFEHFGIKIKENTFKWSDPKRGIKLIKWANEEFKHKKKKSNIARLIGDNTLSKYMIDNEALLDDRSSLGKVTQKGDTLIVFKAFGTEFVIRDLDGSITVKEGIGNAFDHYRGDIVHWEEDFVKVGYINIKAMRGNYRILYIKREVYKKGFIAENEKGRRAFLDFWSKIV